MLRALIGNLEHDDEQKAPIVVGLAPSANKNALTDKEIQSLRSLLERMPDLEGAIEKILRDMKSMNL